MSIGSDPNLNPYLPPTSPLEPAFNANDAADRVARLALLPRESAVRSVGTLGYGLVAVLGVPGAYFGMVWLGVIRSAIPPYGAMQFLQAIGVLGGVILVVSVGLRRLWAGFRWAALPFLGLELFNDVASLINDSYLPLDGHLGDGWARVIVAIRVVVGLAGVGVLFWPGQRRVLGRDYRQVVRATPEIRCPTAWWAWVLMGLAIAEVALLAAGYVVVLSRPR